MRLTARESERFKRVAAQVEFGCTLKDQRWLVALVSRWLRSSPGKGAAPSEGSDPIPGRKDDPRPSPVREPAEDRSAPRQALPRKRRK
jgi:hypothetical protein